ncbi:hypothetical protein [Gymnodinialimonas sp.]
MALPASAQDFRGLLPGMATAELARLGESEAMGQLDDGTTRAVYPLPYGQRLEVIHAGPDGILALATSGDPFEAVVSQRATLPPFQSYATSLAQAVSLAGSEGQVFEARGQFITPTNDRFWWLTYTLADHPDLTLELRFIQDNAPTPIAARDDGFYDLPGDATLTTATLYSAAYLARHPDRFGTTRLDRPGAAPFALPLAEAFPLTILPQ